MDKFETWWNESGQESLYALNTLTDADAKVLAEIAWEAALAEQSEQEPVGWWNGKETVWFGHELITDGPIGEFQIPLYTAPQPVSKEQVAVLDITYGREPECYATPNADDLPEGTYRLYAAPVRQIDLTDDEILQCGGMDGADDWAFNFARAVIAAYKEKNK